VIPGASASVVYLAAFAAAFGLTLAAFLVS